MVETYSPEVPTDFYGVADTVRIVSGNANPFNFGKYTDLVGFRNYGHIETMDTGSGYSPGGIYTMFYPENYGNIGTANVDQSLKSCGDINTVNITGGYVYNGWEDSNGSISKGTIGTAYVSDRGFLRTFGSVKNANVNDGGLDVTSSGSIGTVSMNTGGLSNAGSIETVDMNNDVSLSNSGSIGTLNLNSNNIHSGGSNTGSIGTANLIGGRLENFGSIETTNVDGGRLNIHDGSNIGTLNFIRGALGIYTSMETVDISNGDLDVGGNGSVETAIVNDGNLHVVDNGSVGTATINGEYSYVDDSGHIGTAIVNGGSFSNQGTINKLYVTSSGDDGIRASSSGAIGEAHIAGANFENGGGATTLGTVHITQNGEVVNGNTYSLNNPYDGHVENIGTAYVNDDSALINQYGAHVETAFVNGNGVYVFWNEENEFKGIAGDIHIKNTTGGTIGSLTINNGRAVNDGRGANNGLPAATIGNVSVGKDGALENFFATVDSASITGNGIINNVGSPNSSQGTIGEVVISDQGRFLNGNDVNGNVSYGSAVGSVSVTDNGRVTNSHAVIDSLTVSDNAQVVNDGYASYTRIVNANISGRGTLENHNGEIDTLSISDNGFVQNGHFFTGTDGFASSYYTASVISNVNMSDEARLENDSATIKNAIVHGGYLNNIYSDYKDGSDTLLMNLQQNGGTVINTGGQIDSAVINGGTLDNTRYVRPRLWADTIESNGVIGDLIQHDGAVNNDYNCRIENAIVYGGNLGNQGTITNLQQNGGTVANSAKIENMTYTDGTYTASQFGTIGKLTIAGDATGIEWGNVGDVVFASDGSGITSIKALASASPEPAMQPAAMRTFAAFTAAAAPEATTGTTFVTGLENAESINWTYSNIVIDAAGTDSNLLVALESALMDSILGGEKSTGVDGLRSISLVNTETLDENLLVEALAMMNSIAADLEQVYGVAWASPMTMTEDGRIVATAVSAVPEPATLVMVGLGLVGLGLARRRWK